MVARYDLLVIGAGSVGSTAAATAARLGKRVALVERDQLGGTCLNYGCDPTKALPHAARLLHQARHAGPYGLRVTATVEWPAVLARVREVQERIRGGTPDEAREQLAQQGITVLYGEARFASPHEVVVGEQLVRAERIVVACGGEVVAPPVEGLREAGFLTNVRAVALPELPRRLAVIGSGSLGVEFAQLFARFGGAVTVIERGAAILEKHDRELADQLRDVLTAEGIAFKTGAELQRVARRAGGKRLMLGCGECGEADLLVDEILVATGRRPALAALQPEAAGIATHERGIVVDDTLRTSVPHIWAAGDITGHHPYTHVATDQGRLAARNAFAAVLEQFTDQAIPRVTYTDPELAHIGRTEAELRAAGVAYRVARLPFAKLDRAIVSGETAGLVKLLAGTDGALLGCQILGAAAGELLAPVAVALRNRLPVMALAETVLPYPTLAEAVRWAADQLVTRED